MAVRVRVDPTSTSVDPAATTAEANAASARALNPVVAPTAKSAHAPVTARSDPAPVTANVPALAIASVVSARGLVRASVVVASARTMGTST